jgi:hypothetical protein
VSRLSPYCEKSPAFVALLRCARLETAPPVLKDAMTIVRSILAVGDCLMRLILRPIVGIAAMIFGTMFILLCRTDRWLAAGRKNLGDELNKFGRKDSHA